MQLTQDFYKNSFNPSLAHALVLRSGHGALPPFLIVVFEAKNGAVEKLRSRPSPLPLGELKEASSIAVLIHQNEMQWSQKKSPQAFDTHWVIQNCIFQWYVRR